MAQRICSCCGQGYTDESGHEPNACVQRCSERLAELMDDVEDAKCRLHNALERQKHFNDEQFYKIVQGKG
jgi:hypothetical protein